MIATKMIISTFHHLASNISNKNVIKNIDNIMSNTKGTTHYVGQIEWTILEINSHKITIQIRYLKSYVEWRFDEK